MSTALPAAAPRGVVLHVAVNKVATQTPAVPAPPVLAPPVLAPSVLATSGPAAPAMAAPALATSAPAPSLQTSPRKARPPKALSATAGADSPLTRPPERSSRPRYVEDDFFGQQPASTSALPDPQPLLENLTRCVIEVLAGARDLEQLARWVSDDVYRHLLKRVVLSTRARRARSQPAKRPAFSIGSTSICEPRDGVVEAVVIVCGRARTRAVAIRLEGLDSRWRATAINVL